MFDMISNRKNKSDFLNFDNFFKEFLPDNFFSHSESRMMRLDIKETENAYIFDVELPGITRQDIDLGIIDDVLTISVNKTSEVTEENVKYIRKERKYGSYSRSFSIPNIDAENIRANFEHGILTITLPKLTPTTQTRRNISIE